MLSTATMQDYEEGYASGVEWGEADVREQRSTAAGLDQLAEEATTAAQRWSRAYYLGAMRGYRSVIRTRKGGRWGT
jgi:hypothetical protein